MRRVKRRHVHGAILHLVDDNVVFIVEFVGKVCRGQLCVLQQRRRATARLVIARPCAIIAVAAVATATTVVIRVAPLHDPDSNTNSHGNDNNGSYDERNPKPPSAQPTYCFCACIARCRRWYCCFQTFLLVVVRLGVVVIGCGVAVDLGKVGTVAILPFCVYLERAVALLLRGRRHCFIRETNPPFLGLFV